MFEQEIETAMENYGSVNIYYHNDLDGVASALFLKKWFENRGMNINELVRVDYSNSIYNLSIPSDDIFCVSVDFIFVVPFMHVMIDHHNVQMGEPNVEQITLFEETFSCFDLLCKNMTSEVNPTLISAVNKIDSADFVELEPEEVLFPEDASDDFRKALLARKYIAAIKNYDESLNNIVSKSDLTMDSILKHAAIEAENNHRGHAYLEKVHKDYLSDQLEKSLGEGVPSDIKSLRGKFRGGVSLIYENIIYQLDGGDLRGGRYDRYTKWAIYPDADYAVMGWSFGLLQISSNPFKENVRKIDLQGLLKNVLSKYEKVFSKKSISLLTLKSGFEKNVFPYYDTEHEVIGFGPQYFDSFFGLDNINGDIENFIDKPLYKYTDEEKTELSYLTVPMSVILNARVGGHNSICNVGNLEFWQGHKTDVLISNMMSGIASCAHKHKIEGAK